MTEAKISVESIMLMYAALGRIIVVSSSQIHSFWFYLYVCVGMSLKEVGYIPVPMSVQCARSYLFHCYLVDLGFSISLSVWMKMDSKFCGDIWLSTSLHSYTLSQFWRRAQPVHFNKKHCDVQLWNGGQQKDDALLRTWRMQPPLGRNDLISVIFITRVTCL